MREKEGETRGWHHHHQDEEEGEEEGEGMFVVVIR